MIIHPVTAEIVTDDLNVLVPLEARVDLFLRRLGPHYAFRSELRERIAELRGPAVLPRPRWRSERQSRVGVCPRCGDKAAA